MNTYYESYFCEADGYEAGIPDQGEQTQDEKIIKLQAQVNALTTTLKMVLVHLQYRSTGEQEAEFAGMLEFLREVAL